MTARARRVIRAGDDPVAAWRAIGETPAILEALVAFEREVSVIVARGGDGALARLRRRGEHSRRRDPRRHQGTGRASCRYRRGGGRARRSDRRGARPCRRSRGRDVRDPGRERKAAARQRDRAAGPQFRALDHRMPASARSSSSTSARSAAGRSAIPPATPTR